ncbi:MAG TPA: HD domain-containing protein [Candidatus Avamphibacillus sp.]|nr:HD domain-containing protein [Candidatus Avamphibacillus sp.]
MDQRRQLREIRKFIYSKFHHDETGHDFYHMARVAEMAKLISISENADSFICEVAGWVHDIGDHKLFNHPNEEIEKMKVFLKSIHINNKQIAQINDAIKDVSFSKGNLTPKTLEGKIVQDADRIDAIGAIGIARTFAYGGANGQLIYHPVDKEGTSIQHFYDKLLKLKDSINTSTGAKMAEERHLILKNFLEQFFHEWIN